MTSPSLFMTFLILASGSAALRPSISSRSTAPIWRVQNAPRNWSSSWFGAMGGPDEGRVGEEDGEQEERVEVDGSEGPGGRLKEKGWTGKGRR